jgi:hypothetical protein
VVLAGRVVLRAECFVGPFLSRLCCPRSPRVSSPTANPGDTDGLVSGSPGESGGSLTASAFKSYTRKVYHSTSFKRRLWVVPKNNQFTAEPAYIWDPGTLAELPAWFDYDKYMIRPGGAKASARTKRHGV